MLNSEQSWGRRDTENKTIWKLRYKCIRTPNLSHIPAQTRTDSLYMSAWAAATKYHRLGASTTNLVSHSSGNQEAQDQSGQFSSWRVLSYKWLAVVSHDRREGGKLSGISSCKSNNPIMGLYFMTSYKSTYFPRAPSSKSHHILRLEHQHMDLREQKHSVHSPHRMDCSKEH